MYLDIVRRSGQPGSRPYRRQLGSAMGIAAPPAGGTLCRKNACAIIRGAPSQLNVRGVPPGKARVGKTVKLEQVWMPWSVPIAKGPFRSTAAGLAVVARGGQVRPLLRDGGFCEARTT